MLSSLKWGLWGRGQKGWKKEKERKLDRGMNREMPRRVKPGVSSREGLQESRKEREGKKGEREE